MGRGSSTPALSPFVARVTGVRRKRSPFQHTVHALVVATYVRRTMILSLSHTPSLCLIINKRTSTCVCVCMYNVMSFSLSPNLLSPQCLPFVPNIPSFSIYDNNFTVTAYIRIRTVIIIIIISLNLFNNGCINNGNYCPRRTCASRAH